MTRALASLLVLGSLSIGCTVTTTQADADTPKPNSSDADAPKPNAEPEPASEPDDVKPAPAPRAQLPDCPAEQGNAIANYCTDDGKLAGSWVPVDALKVPDDVEIIFTAEGPDASKQTRLLLAIRGSELYIEHVTCGACRRVLGQGFAGHLAHMNETQIRAMQTQLGLGDDAPLLDSTEKWTSFCAEETGKSLLTQIAGKTEGAAESDGRRR